MSEDQNISIESKRDLIQIRRITRSILQNMNAPLRDQARISWLTNYIANQALCLNSETVITLKPINEGDKIGIEISCEGWWLRAVGFSYELHIVPVISKTDTVRFTQGTNPKLSITAWLSENEGK